MKTKKTVIPKPLLRGHFHQAAFFFASGACLMLMLKSHSLREFSAIFVYSLSLIGLFGISALYHRPQWSPEMRTWMRRFDHTAIFVLIAGTATPICLLTPYAEAKIRLLILIWIAAGAGILQSLFWVNAPKWLTALICVLVGWLAIPYFGVLRASLSSSDVGFILAGGIVYSLGALVYALKRPNPNPQVFGYHEIFHLMVIVAAAFHFIVIYRLVV